MILDTYASFPEPQQRLPRADDGDCESDFRRTEGYTFLLQGNIACQRLYTPT
jgi:hypothetical protein